MLESLIWCLIWEDKILEIRKDHKFCVSKYVEQIKGKGKIIYYEMQFIEVDLPMRQITKSSEIFRQN